ncbi:urea transporter 2 [Nematolebias whitei]|uniref:urea transporter 2 n=1 Tax=Nematolebias whitei TaxID=451745 RepID=UPI00189BDAB8|nr:urea transporter 2 [Nematolebias whitei]
MWMETKTEMESSRSRTSCSRLVLDGLMLCTGDMEHLDKYMQDKLFVMQLLVWGLRGVSRVILANSPLSGALILATLCWASPWQCLLGVLGVLVSTLTAVITGQDSADVAGGLHGFNGMLVSLLMGVYSSAGDWYWWLLLPACLGSATCVFLSSGLTTFLDHWDLPASVFPFNIIIVLYLLCTGADNTYFPHHPTVPPGALDHNDTNLVAAQVICGIPLGVGQIYACGTLGPSLLILGAVVLYSPLLAVHAVLGSAVGTLAGQSQSLCAMSLCVRSCERSQNWGDKLRAKRQEQKGEERKERSSLSSPGSVQLMILNGPFRAPSPQNTSPSPSTLFGDLNEEPVVLAQLSSVA